MEVNKQLLDENDILNNLISFLKLETNYYIPSIFALTGGAVIDILEGRKPKDYDFIGHSDSTIKYFIKNGFTYQQTTKSAITIKKDDLILQFLNTPICKFDFKISQARYYIGKRNLELDYFSFENKTLIPVDFEDKRNALNSLRRIIHWKKKGYSINDLTYLSLLNVLAKHKPLSS